MDLEQPQNPAGGSGEPAQTLTELSDRIMEAHQKYGAISTSATIGRIGMSPEDEPRLLGIVAMFRLNGGAFLYGRRVEGERVVWERISLNGSPHAVAWFYRELDAEPSTADAAESLY